MSFSNILRDTKDAIILVIAEAALFWAVSIVSDLTSTPNFNIATSGLMLTLPVPVTHIPP